MQKFSGLPERQEPSFRPVLMALFSDGLRRFYLFRRRA
jgi:hypothetical protein